MPQTETVFLRIAQSLPPYLSRLAARRVAIHPRKQRSAGARDPAIRVRFEAQAFSLSSKIRTTNFAKYTQFPSMLFLHRIALDRELSTERLRRR